MANEYAIPSSLDSILATTLSDYAPKVTDNVYNSNVVLKRLNDRKKLVNGGASKTYPLIISDQNAGGFYSGAQILNTTQPDAETLVEYRFQNMYEPIQLTRDEERSNSGDVHKIVDLVGEKMTRAELAAAKRLEQAISTPVAGAGYLVDLETLAATGTLGTIAGATTTAWQATVTASGSFAAQGLSDITTAYYAVSGASNEDNPTIHITTKANFQRFEATRLPLERFSSGELTAKAGFKSLMFKDTPVVYGNFIGSGLWFGLNENYIDLVVDSETDFVMTDFVLPVNQTAKVAFILWRGNLCTSNRRRHFKLTGITA